MQFPTDQVKPISMVEYANQYSDLANRNQQQILNQQKIDAAPQQQEYENRLNAAKAETLETGAMDSKYALVQKIADASMARFDSLNIPEGDPRRQQALEQIIGPHRSRLAKLLDKPEILTNPADEQALRTLAGLANKNTRDNFIVVYDQNGVPHAMNKATSMSRSIVDENTGQPIQGSAQYSPEAVGARAGAKKAGESAQEIEDYRSKKQIDTETPKPISEFQQYKMDEEIAKKENVKQSALMGIDEAVSGIDELAKIQKRTKTGPLASNAVSTMLRRAGSDIGLDDYTGGKDLTRLKKGYASEAVKAIAAFKAIGVSFGQLSNAEGQWVKDTAETLDSDGEVNLEMLAKGKALLQKRRDLLINTGSAGSAQMPTAQQSTQDIPAPEATKVLNGITFIKTNGKWHQVTK